MRTGTENPASKHRSARQGVLIAPFAIPASIPDLHLTFGLHPCQFPLYRPYRNAEVLSERLLFGPAAIVLSLPV
ncbi:hypothetical protein ES703_109529 [subsurface metagenome]